jgi:hypothetical protein
MHDGIRKSQYLYYKPASNPGPAPRDDVESLGYTFLNLARGDLPWSYNVLHGTKNTQHDQVRIKKQRYSGADLPLMDYLALGR